MTTTTDVRCNQCGDTFENWGDLAVHIMGLKKTHKNKKHRMWAANYLNKKLLQQKVEFKHNGDDPDKQKTDFGEENRQNQKRRLSGTQNYESCVCPKCKKGHRILLEAEFAKSRQAWRIGDRLVKLCQSCGMR